MPASTDTRDRDALLRAWRDDADRLALDDLLRRELEPIKRSFRRRLAGYARTASRDTSDYVDEAVERLLRQSPAPVFDEPRGLRAYLTKAAVHLFVNHYHAARRRPVHVTVEDLAGLVSDGAGSPAREADLAELADLVQLALNLMPEKEASLLKAHVIDGRSVRDLAGELGMPKTTVARRVEEAKSNLVLTMLRWRRWMAR